MNKEKERSTKFNLFSQFVLSDTLKSVLFSNSFYLFLSILLYVEDKGPSIMAIEEKEKVEYYCRIFEEMRETVCSRISSSQPCRVLLIR